MHADAAVTGLSRTPATALRNTVQPLADVVNVTLKSRSGQTANHIEGRSFASVLQWSISAVGFAFFSALSVTGNSNLGTVQFNGVANHSADLVFDVFSNQLIRTDVSNSQMHITGGNSIANGANLALYSVSHSTRPGEWALRFGTTDIFAYTAAGLVAQPLAGVGTRFVTVTAAGVLGSTTIAGAGGVLGSGVADRVAYWSAADTITSSANLTFNGTDLIVGASGTLTLGYMTIGRIPIVGTGGILTTTGNLTYTTGTTTFATANGTFSGTLSVTGVATFTSAPVINSATALRIPYINATKQLTTTANLGYDPSTTIITLGVNTIVASSGVTTIGAAGSAANNLIVNGYQVIQNTAGNSAEIFLTTTGGTGTPTSWRILSLGSAQGILGTPGSLVFYNGTTSTVVGSVTAAGAWALPGTLAVTGTSTLTGRVGIGAAPASQYQVNIAGTYGVTGVSQYALVIDGTFTSAATSLACALYTHVSTAAATTTATAYGIYIEANSKGAGSTITTGYGLFINNQTTAVTNYALYTNTGLVRFGDVVTFAADLSLLANNTIIFADNSAAALTFSESSNLYLRFVTTNAAEKVIIYKALEAQSTLAVTGNTTLGGSGTAARRVHVTGTVGDTGLRINAPAGAEAYLELSQSDTITSGNYWQLGLENTTKRLYFWNGGTRLEISAAGVVTVPGTFAVTGAVTLSSTLAVTGQFISSASGGGPTAGVLVSGAAPALGLRETDAASDGQYWDILANSGALAFRAINNANTLSGTAILITRSLTAITSVAVNSTLTVNSDSGSAGAWGLSVITTSSGNGIQSLDNVRDHAGNVFRIRMRTAGSAITALSIAGDGSVTIPLQSAFVGVATFKAAVEFGDTVVSTATLKLGQLNALPTNVDASWIYATITAAGVYPFNAFGHLVLQARSSAARDIVFMSCIGASTTPTLAMAIEETAASRITMVRAVSMSSTLAVTSTVTLTTLAGSGTRLVTATATGVLGSSTAAAFGLVAGTSVANRVAYWSATDTITGSANLTFSGTALVLTGTQTISSTLGVTGAITATGGIVFNGGGTNLNHYETGSYTATLTGCTTSPTVTVNYTRIGNMVFLSFASSLTATSNTSACTITGAPSAIRPATAQGLAGIYAITDGGGTIVNATATDFGEMGTGGTIVLYRASNANGFSAGANKGMRNSQALGAGTFTCCYLLT